MWMSALSLNEAMQIGLKPVVDGVCELNKIPRNVANVLYESIVTAPPIDFESTLWLASVLRESGIPVDSRLQKRQPARNEKYIPREQRRQLLEHKKDIVSIVLFAFNLITAWGLLTNAAYFVFNWCEPPAEIVA